MKAGDKFPVTIAGETITDAVVKEVNEKDSMATLMVPATLVTMSYRTHDELTPGDPAGATPEAVEGNDHVLLTDHVVKPGNDEGVTNMATQQVPQQTEAAPTPEQTTAPVVPTEVEEAIEEKATE